MSRDSRIRVLIVDDESSMRFLLKYALESGGYEVVEAPNGVVALAQIAESRPDLVVTDMMMPGMGGAELIAPSPRSGDQSSRSSSSAPSTPFRALPTPSSRSLSNQTSCSRRYASSLEREAEVERLNTGVRSVPCSERMAA